MNTRPGAIARSNRETGIGVPGDTFRCIAPDIIGFGDPATPSPRRTHWLQIEQPGRCTAITRDFLGALR